MTDEKRTCCRLTAKGYALYCAAYAGLVDKKDEDYADRMKFEQFWDKFTGGLTKEMKAELNGKTTEEDGKTHEGLYDCLGPGSPAFGTILGSAIGIFLCILVTLILLK